MFGWMQRLKRRQVIPTFLGSLEETIEFQNTVKELKCLACKQTTLEIADYSRSLKGWEANVQCTNCNFRGRVNNEGFILEQLNSKGKARD